MAHRAFIAMLTSMVLLATGCLYSGTPAAQLVSERMIKAVAIAHPPVGNVLPVFVAIQCDNCKKGYRVLEPYIIRENVYALNSSDQYVQALEVGVAARDAGGAESLAPLLTKVTDDQAEEIHGGWFRERFSHQGGLMMVLNEGAFLNEQQKWRLDSTEGKKLQVTSLQDEEVANFKFCTSVSMTKESPLSMVEEGIFGVDKSEFVLNRNNGWVFFPNGKYKGMRLDVYMWPPDSLLPHFGGDAVLVEQITLPWVEQQGIPQGNYPALTGIRRLCY